MSEINWEEKRNAKRVGLPLNELSANGMHCDAVRGMVERGQDTDEFDIVLLSQLVEAPGGILSAAP